MAAFVPSSSIPTGILNPELPLAVGKDAAAGEIMLGMGQFGAGFNWIPHLEVGSAELQRCH
jgi:hypothetical protein